MYVSVKMANCLADVHDPLSHLPTELLKMVIAQLDPESRDQLALTSKRMRAAIQDHNTKFLRDFNLRTKRAFSLEELDAQLRILDVEPTWWNRERFLDALWFLNNYTSIDATDVIPDTQRAVYFSFVKGSRMYSGAWGKHEFFQERFDSNEDFTDHRDDGSPSFIMWNQLIKGKKMSAIYKIHGACHRDEDLPANIEWHSNGRLKRVDYYRDDVHHRDNGQPYTEAWHDNGVLKMQEWEPRGNDMPTCIRWDSKGELVSQTWYDTDWRFLRKEGL
jgi:hypothetical protein